MRLTVFILAAGRGERLRPVTDHFPKPLLPVLGKPVLKSILEKVSHISGEIGINLHYKKETIANWLGRSDFGKMVRLFPEEPVLGTGGALKNAEDFLKDGLFLVHNSDIVSDIDLENLISLHISSGNLATLAVHDRPEFNKLILDKNGLLTDIVKQPRPILTSSRGREVKKSAPLSRRRRSGGWGRLLAFTGIAVYRPEFLNLLPDGISSVVDAWLRAVEEGYAIGTLDVGGCFWSDIGTPGSYAATVIHALRDTGETLYIDPSASWCKNVELDGYIVIEKGTTVLNNAAFKNGISVRNCIMLPGAEIGSDCHYEDCILGPGFKLDLSPTEMPGSSGGAGPVLIGSGGSDRTYYRIKRNDHPAVLMQCADSDPDFLRHIEYTLFFRKHSVPVPELLEAESERMRAFFEDLGDTSLYSWLGCEREKEEIEEIYERVLDILVLIHGKATRHVSECPLLTERVFDYGNLRWETGYFLERFISGVVNMSVDNISSLNEEFHRLAMNVDSFPRRIIHRDYQSQNIMITKGGITRLLDYQGARMGPPAYDVASILWDPYYRLDDDLRERLLNYYIRRIRAVIKSFEENEFRDTLLSCRLQRHMQALGAYGFLSVVKGKKYFGKYIPEGLRLLKEDLDAANSEYPILVDLVKRIAESPHVTGNKISPGHF
jgi:NDP-sugar pyrophosphorylase family protein/aminoglycoside/choline kinase family phosphotransferase